MARPSDGGRLISQERIAFVQLAAAFDYTIVPFASLGGEDSLQILLDAGDIMNSQLGRLLRASSVAKTYLRGGLEFPPLVRGLGLTWVPKPERSFVSFGRPISTARYRCRTDDVGAMREQRNRMASSIEAQLAQLQQVLSRLSGQGADAPKTAHDWGELVAEFERQVDRATRRMGGATEATPRRTQSRTNRT